MNTDEVKPASYKHPILWVPTSYFAMGTVYAMVTTAANIMFANLGLPNDQLGALFQPHRLRVHVQAALGPPP